MTSLRWKMHHHSILFLIYLNTCVLTFISSFELLINLQIDGKVFVYLELYYKIKCAANTAPTIKDTLNTLFLGIKTNLEKSPLFSRLIVHVFTSS